VCNHLRLRAFAIVSNLLFIVYGVSAELLPPALVEVERMVGRILSQLSAPCSMSKTP
jgi:hypothetical protein